MRGDFAIGVGWLFFSFAAVGFRMVLRVGALAGAGFNAVLPAVASFGVVAVVLVPLLAFGVVVVVLLPLLAFGVVVAGLVPLVAFDVVIAGLTAVTAVIAGGLAVFLRAAELRVLDGIVLHAHQNRAPLARCF